MPEFLLQNTAGFSKLSYQKEGTGPVMILLHGFPDRSGLWRKVVPLLAPHFTVICPDLPGAGNSSGVQDGKLTMERMAEAVAAIAEKESRDSFLLAGHSMGGYTALAFAERWGDRLKGLSLIHSTAAPDGEEKKSQRQKTIELIQRGGKDAFIREAVPAMFSTHTRNSAPEIVSEQLERGRSLPGESAIAFYEAIMNRPDRTEVLMKADYPVQWVLGKDDSIVTLSAVLEQTQFSQRAFVQVYEDCGHLAMLESPERLAADLTEFARYSFKT